jgi:hypothetical protein
MVLFGRTTSRHQAGVTIRNGASCIGADAVRSRRCRNSQAASTALPPVVACGAIVVSNNGRNCLTML